MIGRINPSPTLPSFSKGCINHNNDTHLEKKPFINQITGSVIKVKNTIADLRTIDKERTLYKKVIVHEYLKEIANIKTYTNQLTRFSYLGYAVTATSIEAANGKAKEKSVDICDKYRMNQSVKCSIDSVAAKRGQEYINQFCERETEQEASLDLTNYATGLDLGSTIKNNKPDIVMINQFDFTWNLRLNGSE